METGKTRLTLRATVRKALDGGASTWAGPCPSGGGQLTGLQLPLTWRRLALLGMDLTLVIVVLAVALLALAVAGPRA